MINHYSKTETISKPTDYSQLLQIYFSPAKSFIFQLLSQGRVSEVRAHIVKCFLCVEDQILEELDNFTINTKEEEEEEDKQNYQRSTRHSFRFRYIRYIMNMICNFIKFSRQSKESVKYEDFIKIWYAKKIIRTYSVKQSNRNSSKTDIFHRPTTYEQHIQTISQQKKLLIDTNTDKQKF